MSQTLLFTTDMDTHAILSYAYLFNACIYLNSPFYLIV